MKLPFNMWRALALTLVGLIIAFFLLRQVDLEVFVHFIREIRIVWIVLAFALYILVSIFRAVRWQLMLLSRNIKVKSLFYISSIHVLFMHLLPARSGELSYVFLLKKVQSIGVKEGFATLIFARLLDLACLGVFFLISIFTLWHQIQVPVLRMILTTLFFLPLFVMILFMLFSRMGSEKLETLLEKLGIIKLHFMVNVMSWLKEFSHAFNTLKRSKKLGSFIFVSILIWGTKFCSFFFILKGFNMPNDISFWATVFGTTFTEVAAILPIHGFAGFGTIEGGWTLGFLLLGLPKDFVIASGFSFHLILLLFALILGCVGFIQIWKTKDSQVMIGASSGAEDISGF